MAKNFLTKHDFSNKRIIFKKKKGKSYHIIGKKYKSHAFHLEYFLILFAMFLVSTQIALAADEPNDGGENGWHLFKKDKEEKKEEAQVDEERSSMPPLPGLEQGILDVNKEEAQVDEERSSMPPLPGFEQGILDVNKEEAQVDEERSSRPPLPGLEQGILDVNIGEKFENKLISHKKSKKKEKIPDDEKKITRWSSLATAFENKAARLSLAFSYRKEKGKRGGEAQTDEGCSSMSPLPGLEQGTLEINSEEDSKNKLISHKEDKGKKKEGKGKKKEGKGKKKEDKGKEEEEDKGKEEEEDSVDSVAYDYDEERNLYFVKDFDDLPEECLAIPDESDMDGEDPDSIFTIKDLSRVPLYKPLDLSSWLRNGRMKEKKNLLVTDYYKFPWNVHGCLMIKENGLRYWGSATLIHPRYLLTAAHNVLNKKLSKIADQVTFYPYNHNKDFKRVMRGKKIIMSREYYEGNYEDIEVLKNKDFAIIQLEDELDQDAYGILGLMEETANSRIKTINITGYPGGSPFFGRYMTSRMINFKKKKCKIEDGRIYYNEVTQKGLSGGGIWMKLNGFNELDKELYEEGEKGERYYLIGIHTHGDGTSAGAGVFLNEMNAWRVDSWIKRLEKNIPKKE